jgi:hypothetical protein
MLSPQAGHDSCIVDYSADQSQMPAILASGLERALTLDWIGATEETNDASVEDYLEVIDRAVEHCSGRVNMMESDQVVATHDRPGDPCREGPVALPRAHRGRGPCRRTPAPPHGPQILGHSRLAIACDEEYAPGTSIGSAAVGTAERVIRKGIG